MPTEPSSGSRSVGAAEGRTRSRSDSSSVKEALSRRGFLGAAGLSRSLTLAGCLDSSDSSDSADSPEGSSDASGENSTNASGSANEFDRTDASEPEDVTFESTTGTELEGTIHGEGRCGVVLTPQINLDRESWSEQARRLADEEYSALAIGEDEDDRPGSILGAVRHLTEERGTERIVLVAPAAAARRQWSPTHGRRRTPSPGWSPSRQAAGRIGRPTYGAGSRS